MSVVTRKKDGEMNNMKIESALTCAFGFFFWMTEFFHAAVPSISVQARYGLHFRR
jgi:hypothetical protein